MPNFFRLKVVFIFAADFDNVAFIIRLSRQAQRRNSPVQRIAQLPAVNVKVNVALLVVIARIKSNARIVNRCPRRLRAITYRPISRENSGANFFTKWSIVAADNRATVIIRAAAQAPPILHVIYPEIIFLPLRDFNFDFHFRGIIFAVSKCHRINIHANKIRRKEIGRKYFRNAI